MELHRHTLVLKIAMVAILGIVLTACGGGDDEADPTATTEPGAAEPTVENGVDEEVVDLVSTPETEEEGTPVGDVPVNIDMSSPGTDDSDSTPETGDAGTPAGVTPPADDAATPAQEPPPGDPVDGTPAAPEDTESDEATVTEGGTGGDEPDVEQDADVVVGDGTTGATGATDVGTEDVATPQASPEAEDAEATPVAVDGPVVVEGCDVADVPPFTGEITTYTLSVDVNFRAGPGTDCDPVGEGPLAPGTSAEITGGPVIRGDDDEFQWVQVQVGESTGWLAFEFLEPAEE